MFGMLFNTFMLSLVLLSGLCLWSSLSKTTNVIESLAFGPIIGVVVMSFGLVIESYSGIYELRLVLPVFIVVTFLVRSLHAPKNKVGLFPAGLKLQDFTIVLFILTLLTPLILGSFHASISHSVSVDENRFWFHRDLLYYWSLASDSIAKAPTVLPHSSQDQLQHTWLFHTTIGAFSELVGVSPNTMLLIVWPIFFACTSVFMMFLIGYKFTSSKYMALCGTMLFVLFRGPTLPNQLGWFTSTPVYILSPHRDFVTLILLVIVYLLLDTKSNERISSPKLGTLFLLSFVASSSKGSIFLLFVGGSLISLVLEWARSKTIKNGSATSFGTIIIGCLSAQVIVVKISGDLEIDLLSNSIGSSVTQFPIIVTLFIFVYLAVLAIISAFNLIAVYESQLIHNFFFGILVSTIVGVTCFDHPGKSQVYFWQNAIPVAILCFIFFANSVLPLVELRSMFYALIVSVIFNILVSNLPQMTSLELASLAITVLLFFIVGFRKLIIETKLLSSLRLRSLLIMSFCLISVTSFSLFGSEPAGGWFTKEDRFLSVSQNQVQAFEFLKVNSESTDLIASNSHCSYDEIIDESCAPIAVWAASISQRRFIAGADYIWGSGRERFARTSGLLDSFLFNPTISSFSSISDLNIKYFLLDKSNDNFKSIDLRGIYQFASLIYSNQSVLIIRILPYSN
jgi:hypothetical protein